MNLSTLDLTIFNLTLDNFILSIIIIVAALVITGIILLVKNVRPILGLLLLIFAVAMIIGVTYDADGIRREVKKFWTKVAPEKADELNIDSP